MKFPQEATDGISDEQYIRNVVDVLFRKKGVTIQPQIHPSTIILTYGAGTDERKQV